MAAARARGAGDGRSSADVGTGLLTTMAAARARGAGDGRSSADVGASAQSAGSSPWPSVTGTVIAGYPADPDKGAAAEECMVFSCSDPATDISKGPVCSSRRGFTDVPWIVAFVLFFLVFMTMAYAGFTGGDARKLIAPRDFRGQYCGMGPEMQWDSGADFRSAERLSYTMNVSGTVDTVVAQLLCSSAAEAALRDLLHESEMDAYLCACCKRPCRSCESIAGMEDERRPEEVAKSVTAKMADLTDPSRALKLFSTGGANGGAFSSVLLAVDQFFTATCARSCGPSNGAHVTEGAPWRRYRFRPAPDSPWRRAWEALAVDQRQPWAPLRRVIASDFLFQAMPVAECPYDAALCVPFPGVGLVEGAGGYCSFRLASDVAKVMSPGGIAHGLGELRGKVSMSLGSLVGEILDSLDVLALVAVSALGFGFLSMVLLRFFVKLAVWGFMLGVPAFLIAGGAVGWVGSDRCNGESLVQSAPTYASAWGSSISAWWNGTDTSAESLVGVGEGYRGVQARTRSGRVCQRWDMQHPHPHTETSLTFPNTDLRENFCRNPNGAAVYIWCYTTDPGTRWEFCEKLGVPPLVHDCPNGHAIREAHARRALKVMSGSAWAVAGIWLLCVFCIFQKIQMAVAVYDAASVFVVQTPLIIAVPVVQTAVVLAWIVFWCYSAATLLTQVPGGRIPEHAMTAVEALGAPQDDAPPGLCAASSPPGFAWHDPGDETLASHPCSGRFGDTSGIQPRCWRCAQPRYFLDYRFAVALGMYFWTSELIIAIGVCIVAGACGAWFFTPPSFRHALGMNHGAVKLGVHNTFMFHLGSLAFGAAIVAVVQFVRHGLLYFEKQAKVQQNKVSESILRCLTCLLWSFERCLKFVSRKAYIQVALVGTPFCTSAKTAFCLIARHPVNFALIGMFANLLRWIGVSFVVASSSLVGFLCLQALRPDTSPVVPTVAFVLLAYSIGSAFLNVFGLAADTILQCLLASREMGLPDECLPKQLRPLRHSGSKGVLSSTTQDGLGADARPSAPPAADMPAENCE